jgi:hypothetical protein
VGVHADLGRALGEVHRVGGVVRAGAGDHGRAAALRHGQLEQAALLLVVERGALAGGAGHDHPVGPVRQQVVHEIDGGRLVDAAIGVERRDHRCEDASDRHRARLPRGQAGNRRDAGFPAK